MKIYKLYRHGNASPELINANENFMFILTIMDNIVNTKPTELIYIVEYDTDLNRDDEILLYHGNYERYLLEKKKILLNIERDKIKQRNPEYIKAIKLRRELLDKESTEITRKFGVKNE